MPPVAARQRTPHAAAAEWLPPDCATAGARGLPDAPSVFSVQPRTSGLAYARSSASRGAAIAVASAVAPATRLGHASAVVAVRRIRDPARRLQCPS